jgi:hypothetical protein
MKQNTISVVYEGTNKSDGYILSHQQHHYIVYVVGCYIYIWAQAADSGLLTVLLGSSCVSETAHATSCHFIGVRFLLYLQDTGV